MLISTLKEIADMTNNEISPAYENIEVRGISTDTRTIQEGNLFIALKGDNFDGHDYVDSALKAGGVCAIVDKNYDNSNSYPIIRVDDTMKFLFDLASQYRKKLGLKVIGITGSNGKTTTKDIMYALLSEKYKVAKTEKNFNNEIGMSKTILDIDEDSDIAILELGIEDFGEMSLLTDIAKPDIAVITNIGDSHLLKLKTRENIARAKLEILQGMDSDGILIFNNDDPILREVTKEFSLPEKTIKYGMNDDSDYRLDILKSDETGVTFNINDHLYSVDLLGKHQMYNAALAIIVAHLFFLDYADIARGLKNIKLTGMRNELQLLNNFHILNDSYKSNPQSLQSCLDAAYGLQGYKSKILVLGDMLELGEDEVAIHRNIGKSINPDKIDYVLTLGDLSESICRGARINFSEDRLFHFDNKSELLEKLSELLVKNSLVVVKASHAMNFADLVKDIKSLDENDFGNEK